MNKEDPDELVTLVVKTKDSQAFERLVKLSHSKVASITYKYLIPYDDQKDIFQEVCIRLWVYLTTGKYEKKGGGIFALVAKITTNLCIDYLRSKKKYNKIPVEFLEVNNHMSISIPQYDLLFSEEDRENLKKFIRSLSRNQQIVYHLRIIKGKSYKEIAEYLNISINTALGRMRHARLNFQKNRAKFNL